jgi:hypothetical protein
MRRRAKSHLITDAPRSPEEELRAREIRYVIMMLLRAVCVIVGAVLVMVRPPLLGLWLVICVLGAVLLPWAAVLLANDRAPRPDARLRNKLHRQPTSEAAEPRALTETESTEHKVIDAER